METLIPKADLQTLLVDAAKVQRSPFVAQLALSHLMKLTKRAIELQDAELLASLESLCLVEKA